MDRNYIIYNNQPFTLIWRLAKKECRRFFVFGTLCLSFRGYPPRLIIYGAFFFHPLLRHTILLFFHQKKLKLKKQQYLFHLYY